MQNPCQNHWRSQSVWCLDNNISRHFPPDVHYSEYSKDKSTVLHFIRKVLMSAFMSLVTSVYDGWQYMVPS